MADKPDPTAENIEFLQYHQPPLKVGNYRLTATQTVSSEAGLDKQKTITGKEHTAFEATQTFTIAGERFSLKPAEILSIFPPDASGGDHAFVMPHLVLNRSTLPWEREGQPGNEVVPWLGLLLFDAAEAPTPQTITYQELFNSGAPAKPSTNGSAAAKPVGYVDLPHEPGDMLGGQAEEQVNVIDIAADLAQKIIPTAAELCLLTHLRQWQESKEGHEPIGAERAVCICNRLPTRGRTSVVHLVSFENRYDDQGQFVFGQAADQALPVRLVSLKSWRFSCPDEESYKLTPSGLTKLSFPVPTEQQIARAGLLNEEIVNKEPFLSKAKAVLGQLSEAQEQELLQVARYKKLTFKSLLMELDQDQFRLPQSALRKSPQSNPDLQNEAERFRQRGYVPLPHHMRTGHKTVSWYHGPLQSGFGPPSQDLPVDSADKLLRINQKYGMVDVSYAAAWELGRLLTLQNKRVSTALFMWKRAHAQHNTESDRLRSQFDHLPFKPIQAAYEFPSLVENWFRDLTLLKGIPFNYLVPDQRMLPVESIRFFNVDNFWLECLLDGAFSIGRVSPTDHQQDITFVEKQLENQPRQRAGGIEQLSGFIIRSDVVAGWSDLQVAGYSRTFEISANEKSLEAAKLPLLRHERLSANTMLVLFDGVLKAVDLHQKPEILHFGVSEADDSHLKPYKRIRSTKTGEETGETVVADFKENTTLRVIDCLAMEKDLAAKLGQSPDLTSAGFALQMIEGVERVRFNAK
ncbi:MAG: hypothetical protein R3264_04940 [Anaerolineae bacterium]|nr:hypothetical protein [Anaerolineae bacterium]